ncbi:MAG: hypothetical protein DHS20C14_18570 [Phycisphaeraceae bacterium]|nr:MAG: hypothetical protein DHS20C14_18570 [Phycisphaeraceae bacterium]
MRQSPSPTDMHITEFDFVDRDTGWVTALYGNWGGLFGTADGGATWSTVLLNEVETFSALQMLDANLGWAAGDAIYSTANGWQTWTKRTIPEEPAGEPNAVDVTRIQFIDSTTGYLSTRPSQTFSYLYKTTDGGLSWDYLGTFELDSWCFADADVGWAADLNHTLIRTNDGGQTWRPVPMPPAITTQSDVLEVFSYDHAIVTTFQDLEIRYSVHQTTDGGQTWASSAPGAPREAIFTNATNGFGYAQFGAPAFTTDGGMTWIEQAELRIDHEYFTDICVVDEDTIYLGGEFGLVLRSDDAGASWAQVSNGSGNDLLRIGMGSATHGWTTGGGTVLRTADGGDTWKHQAGPVLTTFQQLFNAGPSDVYPFGPEHAAIRWNSVNLITTMDGGETWTLGDPNDEWPSGRIFVSAPDAYYKFGFDNGSAIVYRSADGGDSWAPTTSNIPSTTFDAGDVILDFYFQDDSHGWVIGEPNLAFRTQDGGQTWDRTPDIGRLPSPVYRRVRFATPDVGWIIGSYGLILRTTDGGDTWTEQTLPGTFGGTYTDLAVVSQTEAYICGQNENNRDFVKHTTDGGQTWTDSYTPGLGHPFEFFQSANNGLAVVDGNVWAVGAWGSIVHLRAPGCPADLNADGTLNVDDIDAFVVTFLEGNLSADFDANGVLNVDDIDAFVASFITGCP